jgi:hypothetical protein
MTTESNEASHAAAPSLEADTSRAALRNRKKEKQQRYRRHKAHLTTPKNAADSPLRTAEESSKSTDVPEVEAPEGSSVPALSTPPRKNGLSSAYIQNKLSTPTRKNVPKEEPPEKSTLQKRHQEKAGSRKSGLINKMREKKRAVVPLKPDNATTEVGIFQHGETAHVVQDEKPEESCEVQEEEQQHEEVVGGSPDDDKASEPGTVTTVESEAPVDEASCNSAEPSDMAPVQERTDPSNEDDEQTTQDEVPYYEDPSLMDVQSEVSGAESAFDMRSILEHPPSPPPASESTPTDEDMENVETSTDIAVSNPMDDDFVHRLMRLDSSQEEEKKEVEDENLPSQPHDTAWDISNPLFEQRFAPVARDAASGDKPGDAPDMFGSTSWEEADATFADVESQLLHLINQTQIDTIGAGISFEEKQILEDVKRNLELANSIDKADSGVSEAENCSVPFSPPRTRLDTLEDEPSSNSDEAGEESSEKPTNSKTVEVVKDDEPLLLQATSSSDEGDITGDVNKVSVEERVEMYNAPNEVDEESSTGEEDDKVSLESDDEDDEPDYIGQESDEEDATVDIVNPLSDETAKTLDKEVPTFDAAAVAAIKSNDDAMGEVEGLSAKNGGADTEEDVSTDPEEYKQRLDMMPPPPPPPRQKKKKRRQNTNTSKGSVPLLAPPPEEKLKKWEEEKMSGHAHLAAVKAKIEAAKFDAANINGPPAMSRSWEPSLFKSYPAKQSKGHSEQARSPSNMDNVLTDQKMAERVAMASSAAAVSFEEHLDNERSNSSREAPQGKNSESPTAGGAFQNWSPDDFGTFPFRPEGQQDAYHSPPRKPMESLMDEEEDTDPEVDDKALLTWLSREVMGNTQVQTEEQSSVPLVIRILLEDDDNFNKMCEYMADSVNAATASLGDDASFDELTLTTTVTEDDSTVATSKSKQQTEAKQRPLLKPMVLSQDSQNLPSGLLAANFVSFLYLASKLSRVLSPFGSSNPFLTEIVSSSLRSISTSSKLDHKGKSAASPQQVIFDHPLGQAVQVVGFVYDVCKKSAEQRKGIDDDPATALYNVMAESEDPADQAKTESSEPSTPCAANTTIAKGRRFVVPFGHPSPFETAVWEAPRIVPAILSFLGDPVAVCRVKMVNRYCRRLVSENEHMIMQDAVRAGGLNMNVRPAFWMWIVLQKCDPEEYPQGRRIEDIEELKQIEKSGEEGKWHHVIERDVERSFGNMPPHKTSARLRTDSIVRALVTWGQNRIMKRGVKGGGEETPLPGLGESTKRPKDKPTRSSASPPPWECSQDNFEEDDSSETPTDTVSDWGPISPAASMTENSNVGFPAGEYDAAGGDSVIPPEELALAGPRLTAEMKSDLQNKLRFVLHSLAASHGDVGYCQGMDYVVAHLLRILQDTIRWNALQGTLPSCIVSTSSFSAKTDLKDESLAKAYEEVDKLLVVEEVIFRFMDTFFTNYNLRHMYWPELRCLKTCCRVFERLIQIKLPVLADHFEHHDLNVGLFALGWFQTLFLYLPSMPSATVCHMWDIWLVERSLKIFFRVGTAILFLSQPILLNHELEGMMTYLNTIPDATLLKPDILIPCALNIKVTNSMLQELEAEVTSSLSY